MGRIGVIHQFLNLPLHVELNVLHEFLKRGIRIQLFNTCFYRLGITESIDIRDLHSPTGDDKLPAGRHCIIPGIFQGIAQLHQAVYNYIIVGILWEAKARLRKLGALAIHFQRCLAIHAQINFGVNHQQLSGSPEAGRRKIVENRVSLPIVVKNSSRRENASSSVRRPSSRSRFQYGYIN